MFLPSWLVCVNLLKAEERCLLRSTLFLFIMQHGFFDPASSVYTRLILVE